MGFYSIDFVTGSFLDFLDSDGKYSHEIKWKILYKTFSNNK
jgi:hypothetical protein